MKENQLLFNQFILTPPTLFGGIFFGLKWLALLDFG